MGLEFAAHRLSVALSIVLLALFVRQWRRARNPFVNPAPFRIRRFSGAALVMTPYFVAFGAMLLSIAQWEQNGRGWSALQTGLAVARGPLLVPITSLLFSGHLIQSFAAALGSTDGIQLAQYALL